MANNEVRGIVHLDAKEKNIFSDEDCQFAELLAREISLIMTRSFDYSRIKELTERDHLTGSYNRRKLDQDFRVAESCFDRYHRPFLLLAIDIDRFKAYNDFHDHPMGDAVFIKISDIITLAIRLCDKLYRYGGEEFVVMLPETGKEGALVVAERIQRLIKEERFEGAEMSQEGKKLTVSIGVATLPDDAAITEALLEVADSSLYKAKESGRNRVCST